MSNPHSLRALAAWLLAAGLGLTPWSSARAQDEPAGSGLRLSGFGTLGLTHLDGPAGWGFRRDAGQPMNGGGTRGDIDSRFGLQLNYTVTDRIELLAQLQLKRRVSSSRALDSLEWLFASYRPRPDITIRLGRVSPDIFLLSDYRSVGFAYPWVRPNVDFYGLLPIFSIEGGDIAREWNDGDVRWRAKLFGGRGRARGPGVAGAGGGDIDFKMKTLVGGMVSREADGLLLRATVARYDGGITPGTNARQAGAGLDQFAMLPLPGVAAEAARLRGDLNLDSSSAVYTALGASFERGDWLLSAELMHASTKLTYAGVTAGYASIGRRFGAFTAYGMAGIARSNLKVVEAPAWAAQLTPVIGPQAAAGAQQLGAGVAAGANLTRIDQRTLSLGLRWDVHPKMAIKLQWDHVKVRPNGGVMWSNAGPAGGSANVATAVLDFVF